MSVSMCFGFHTMIVFRKIDTYIEFLCLPGEYGTSRDFLSNNVKVQIYICYFITPGISDYIMYGVRVVYGSSLTKMLLCLLKTVCMQWCRSRGRNELQGAYGSLKLKILTLTFSF